MVETKIVKEVQIKPSKSERILRIAFFILIITCILLLGAWFAKLIGLALL